MPQIQIIPGAPGFGSQLGQALGSGLGQGFSQGIAANLQNMLEQKTQQRKTQQLLSALGIETPSSNPLQTPNAAINQASAPRSNKLSPLTQEQILAASLMNPQLAPALASIYKNQQKEIKEDESIQTGQEALNRMTEILNEGKLGFGSKLRGKAFGGQTAENVGEFESLSGALESLLVDKVSRGTLSNARFKYITETLLPKANDREATIKGKLKALSKELNLDLPEFKTQKSNSAEGGVLMRDPSGALRRVPKNQAKEAQKAGYKLEQ